MSDSTNDAARWRKPEEELPEVGVRVEAWYLHPLGTEPSNVDCAYWNGGRWIEGVSNQFIVVTCLAWRPIQPLDKPSWIP